MAMSPQMNAPSRGLMPDAPDDQADAVPMDSGDDAGAGGEQASPEEQDQYDKIVANAMNLVYDKKTMPKVIEMLKGEGDPIEGLAKTAATVMMQVTQSAEGSGIKLNGVVLFHAGTEILEDLADLSKEAGVHDFTANSDDLEAAYFRALDDYRVMMQQAGKLDPEAAKADMGKLEAMDKDGQLEKLMVGLAERDAKGKAPPAEDQANDENAAPKSRGLMPEEA